MFYIKEPSSVGSPWTLSQMEDDKTVSISRNAIEDLKNYHVLGIEFLYRSYRKQGAILNEEEDLNMHLQVSAFLNAIYNHAERKLVLVVTPDKSIVCWHYNLTKHGGLNVQIITPHTCPEDFDQEHGLVILLRFTDIKLAEYLIDYNYLSVIIDNFDEIATKMIVKKLHGTFNIGLTRRNFYIDPNQKLQWAMLNWSNPGCVGKLTDFYEIDNDNFANFRDNYRHWWFRLTWSFSESFKEPTCEGKQEYMRTLSKWAVAYNIKNCTTLKRELKTRKRKKCEIKNYSQNDDKSAIKERNITTENISVDDKTIYCSNGIADENVPNKSTKKESNESSEDTNIYSDPETEKQNHRHHYVELPSMDENPILNSIIRNLETSPEPIKSLHYNLPSNPYDLDQPTCSKTQDEDNILMSIIDDTHSTSTDTPLDYETQVSYKKEEIMSQIFQDGPCTSKNLPKNDEGNDFLFSLVGSDGVGVKKGKSDTIDDILKETEELLKE